VSLRVTWLGHSTAVLDVGAGVRLVTDPLLHRHAGLLRRRGARPAEAWRDADAVLLSHLHHDHAELRSLRLLEGAPVLTAPANARWLREKGLRGVGLADAWHRVGGTGSGSGTGGTGFDGTDGPHGPVVEVRLVHAVHGHRPMPHRPNAANGHLVRVRTPGVPDGGTRVWVVGDTERFPGMVHLPRLAGGAVDVALVPVGGWGPRLSGGHLGPAQAARACAEAGVRVAIPVHWGTLHAPGGRHLPRGWMDHAGSAFAAAAQRVAPGTRVVVLRPGESWSAT
jgi:L-ascorbate metabolism protein UlaG (beta-lactamase superfamily)